MLSKFNFKSKKFRIIGGAALIVLILCIAIAAGVSANKAVKKDTIIYDYNEIEQALAEKVKLYLSQYMELQEQTSNDIADTAVQSYRIVMASDTDVINDEITDAVRKRIRSAIFVLADHPEQLTDDTLDALASGVTEIIWQAVLEQISENDRREEYGYLIQSLQEQIDDLNERKTKISINARINDNTGAEITDDAVLGAFRESVKNMSEDEMLELAEKLGISEDQLRKLIESYIGKSNKELSDVFDDKLEDEIDDLRRRLEKEISSMSSRTGETGKTGATGATGAKGEKGDKGEDGAAGENGSDGKTTYIAYADDISGKNFSLTPTETSRYVGTCISTDAKQPTAYSRYSNWQEYRTYIITSTTDPDTGVTTVHIN